MQLDDVIDLVIPRGSNRLVSQIKAATKIPVLGHAGKTFFYHLTLATSY
jgi:delta-1-pyrroline-5-carboxylate synthetase